MCHPPSSSPSGKFMLNFPQPAHDVFKDICDWPTLSVIVSALLSPSVRVAKEGTSTEAQSSAPELMGENHMSIILYMDVHGPKPGHILNM